MKKIVKRICAIISSGTIAAALCPVFSASATFSFGNTSAIVREFEGCTSQTEITEDGTIISQIVKNKNPRIRMVDYITEDESGFQHREYNDIGFLIVVQPADEAAFQAEFTEQYSMQKQADGSIVLGSKDCENLWKERDDILHYAAVSSSWRAADAEREASKLRESAAVKSVKTLEWYYNYSHDGIAYSLNLVTTDTITENDFSFLEDGYAVKISDGDYPSVTLWKDGNIVLDYGTNYQFYRSILNMPDVVSMNLNIVYVPATASGGYEEIGDIAQPFTATPDGDYYATALNTMFKYDYTKEEIEQVIVPELTALIGADKIKEFKYVFTDDTSKRNCYNIYLNLDPADKQTAYEIAERLYETGYFYNITMNYVDHPAMNTEQGDLNGDGNVTVSDAILLARILAEDTTVSVTPEGMKNADVNNSGSPDQDDLTLILKQIAGIKE